jgi:hypothetical protein
VKESKMALRLFNTSKWSKLGSSMVLVLPGTDVRNVAVQVNTEAPTRVDVFFADESGEVGDGVFLGVVAGLETLEFTAEGEAHLSFTTDGEVWYFTNSSGENGSSQVGDGLEAASFTKIASRRTRNPELELMMFKQQQNARRNQEKQRAETDALRALLEAVQGDLANVRNSAPATSAAPASSSEQPASAVEPPAKGTAPDAGTVESVPDGSAGTK